ncbi:glutamate racemase [Rubrivivax gelatinosus]|uniref:glutamate racemase n=1 Tax=Rubrivivax gelatinosus TaxID=28068 RepID=UPI001907A809|nr:glutamate racemase [Rubrivivax gelatinosus]
MPVSDPSLLPARDAPIGVYDSGVGGLSVLRALRARLPAERFIYVADSGHAPYGDRPRAFLLGRAAEIAAFFVAQQAKALVLACNTISVVAAETLRSRHALPIVAMEPAIKPAAAATRSGVVLVLATTATVRSPAVERLCRLYGRDVRIVLQPCPGLVELIEAGRFADPATRTLLERYLRPGLDAGADTVVLGCTHYAFVQDEIRRLAGPGVEVIEPSEAVARQLVRRLGPALAPAGAAGASTHYYSSGDTAALQSFLEAMGRPGAEVRALPAAPG